MTTRTVRIVLGGSFACVLLVLAVVGRNDRDDPASPTLVDPMAESATADLTPRTELGAEVLVDEVPRVPEVVEPSSFGVGYPQTEAGARTAAVNYLEATEEIVQLTPDEASQAQRAISSAASAERLSREVHEQMVGLIAGAPQGIQLWLAPLEARSTETDTGFEVSVWYAEVVAIGTAATVDNWRTITYSLVWEDNTWLIDDRTSTEGPVPARGGGLVVTPPATLVAILDGYDDDGLTP